MKTKTLIPILFAFILIASAMAYTQTEVKFVDPSGIEQTIIYKDLSFFEKVQSSLGLMAFLGSDGKCYGKTSDSLCHVMTKCTDGTACGNNDGICYVGAAVASSYCISTPSPAPATTTTTTTTSSKITSVTQCPKYEAPWACTTGYTCGTTLRNGICTNGDKWLSTSTPASTPAVTTTTQPTTTQPAAQTTTQQTTSTTTQSAQTITGYGLCADLTCQQGTVKLTPLKGTTLAQAQQAQDLQFTQSINKAALTANNGMGISCMSTFICQPYGLVCASPKPNLLQVPVDFFSKVIASLTGKVQVGNCALPSTISSGSYIELQALTSASYPSSVWIQDYSQVCGGKLYSQGLVWTTQAECQTKLNGIKNPALANDLACTSPSQCINRADVICDATTSVPTCKTDGNCGCAILGSGVQTQTQLQTKADELAQAAAEANAKANASQGTPIERNAFTRSELSSLTTKDMVSGACIQNEDCRGLATPEAGCVPLQKLIDEGLITSSQAKQSRDGVVSAIAGIVAINAGTGVAGSVCMLGAATAAGTAGFSLVPCVAGIAATTVGAYLGTDLLLGWAKTDLKSQGVCIKADTGFDMTKYWNLWADNFSLFGSNQDLFAGLAIAVAVIFIFWLKGK